MPPLMQFNAPNSVLYTEQHVLCVPVIPLIHVFLFSFQFLGNTEVEAPKGTEVVKDAVRKLKVKSTLQTKLQPTGCRVCVLK